MSKKYLAYVPLFLCFFTMQVAAAEIPLRKEGGVYLLPVRINSVITLNFVLDSGASEVVIPADVALTLLRTGTISRRDFLPGQRYRLADGSILRGSRFNIRELEIGGYKLTNIPAAVAPMAGPLLLGQSFLSRAGNWSIDNERQVLVIGDFGREQSPPPPEWLKSRTKVDARPGALSGMVNNGPESSNRKIPPSRDVDKTPDGKIPPTR
jgi:hypothetical protein